MRSGWSGGLNTATINALAFVGAGLLNNVVEFAMKLMSEPPPTFSPVTKVSDGFKSWVAATLIKEPSVRPPAADLGNHPWVRGAQADAAKALLARPVATHSL